MFKKRNNQMKQIISLLKVIRDNTTPQVLPPVQGCTCETGKTKKKGKKDKNLFSKKERKLIRKLAKQEFEKSGVTDTALTAEENTMELSQETAILAKDNHDIAHAVLDLYWICAAMFDVCREALAALGNDEDYKKFDDTFQSILKRYTTKRGLIESMFGDDEIIQNAENMELIETVFAKRVLQITNGQWWLHPERHGADDDCGCSGCADCTRCDCDGCPADPDEEED